MKFRDRLHNRRGRDAVVSLSLISLMDIFTILLLFLLVHLAGEEALPDSEGLKLPASTAEKAPRPTVTLLVTDREIFVDGKRVMGVAEAIAQPDTILGPLTQELTRLGDRTRAMAQKTASVTFTGNITIMGDRKIPFQLLKKLMATCAQAEFPHIALAVVQKEQIG
ncbi:MAG: ExbD/TolR family protein [Nitrospirota bacterium]